MDRVEDDMKGRRELVGTGYILEFHRLDLRYMVIVICPKFQYHG